MTNVQYHLRAQMKRRVTYMRPVIPVLARKGAKWNAFVCICLANDVGDGTGGKCPQFPPHEKVKSQKTYVSKSAALSSVPSARASCTSKNLLLRTKTT